MLHTGFHIMTKPIGPICNLDCRYCFYLEKENYYTAERKVHPSWAMSPETLERYIQQYIEAKGAESNYQEQMQQSIILSTQINEEIIRRSLAP